PTALSIASVAPSGGPANVRTLRLWLASLVWSSSRTLGVARTASASRSTTSSRRPSEKFGTTSTSFTAQSWCPTRRLQIDPHRQRFARPGAQSPAFAPALVFRCEQPSRERFVLFAFDPAPDAAEPLPFDFDPNVRTCRHVLY